MEYLSQIDLSKLHFEAWILQTIAMMITAFLIPGFTVSGPIGALIGVVGLAFINAHLWDAALFLALPDAVTTHAILLLLANGIIFWIAVKLLPGIEVKGFLPALAAPIVFSVTGVLLDQHAKDIDWQKTYQKSAAVVGAARDELRKQHDEDSAPTPHATVSRSNR